MKTVSGQVIFSKSISLKKAAKTLSNFAYSENGASPAFSVYLKRASASFNELVQLHKESKILGSEHKVKKRGSMDISGDGIVGSVMNSGDEGLVRERDSSERKKSRHVNKGEGEIGTVDGRNEVQKGEGNLVDGRRVGKKVKKEREDNERVIFKNKDYHEIDDMKMNRLKNETESIDGSLDIEKKKKKKKRDKVEMEEQSFSHTKNFDDEQAIQIGEKHKNKERKHKNEELLSENSPLNALEVKKEIESVDGSIEIKKKEKKNKKNRSDINGDEQSNEIHGDLENGDKNKRIQEGKERKSEGKLEIEATKKGSKKRKHEHVISNELDSSLERHKSKKKR